MQKSSIRTNPKIILTIIGAVLSISTALSQSTPPLVLEVVSSAHFVSTREATDNGDQHLYYEARAGSRIGKYFEVTAGAGYQLRSFIYYASDGFGNQLPLFMDRHYTPVNVAAKLYLSEFFYEKLRLWKKRDRFDVYYQFGLSLLKGRDVVDKAEEDAYRSRGFQVPYYAVPYVQEYGKLYPTYLLGARYNFSRHAGIFLEGGDGPLMTLQLGLSGHF